MMTTNAGQDAFMISLHLAWRQSCARNVQLCMSIRCTPLTKGVKFGLQPRSTHPAIRQVVVTWLQETEGFVSVRHWDAGVSGTAREDVFSKASSAETEY